MNLQKTYSSLVCVCIQCWQYSCAHLRNRQVERVKLVTWQPQQTTRRTSWAEGLHRAAVVSACYLNVLLAVKTEWLGHGRKERCAVFRQQHIVGWYNVHTGIFTRLNCVSAGLSIKKKKKKKSQRPYFVLVLFVYHRVFVQWLIHTSSKRTFDASWHCI